jgi:hypothetical protein
VSWSAKQREARKARDAADPARVAKRRAQKRAAHARKVEAEGRTYVPRGPSGSPPVPHLHHGLELAGQSVCSDDAGAVTAVWDLGRKAPDPNPAPIPEGFPPRKVSTFTVPGGERGRWTTYAPGEVARANMIAEAWERHAAVYAGLAGTAPAPEHTNTDLCTLYPLGDPHIGMLAWAPETGTHWDLSIATREILACVRELVASAPASERAIVTNLGDFLHAQDDANMTPGHGNKLDVDGRFAKVLDAGHALLRAIVDAALTRHRHVTVRNLPGNHDPRVATELAFWLRAVYENEPRVTVADAFRVHQYDQFGSNLIGWTHGDRGPGKELPEVMATDCAPGGRGIVDGWGTARYRVWHTGHVHHESTKEYPGCDVESHGILPPGDAWHAGRYRSRRRMSAITLHRDYGEIARASVGIERVHARVRAEVKAET